MIEYRQEILGISKIFIKRHLIVYDQRYLQVEGIFADSEDATDKVVFTYDALQRKTSQTDQVGVTISYQFDNFKE